MPPYYTRAAINNHSNYIDFSATVVYNRFSVLNVDNEVGFNLINNDFNMNYNNLSDSSSNFNLGSDGIYVLKDNANVFNNNSVSSFNSDEEMRFKLTNDNCYISNADSSKKRRFTSNSDNACSRKRRFTLNGDNGIKSQSLNIGGTNGCSKSVGTNIKMLYTNADSLLNKRDELKAQIEIHKPSIIGIVEIKPKNLRYSVEECEIGIQGYHSFHNLSSEGRGVCLWIEDSLRPAEVGLDSRFREGVLAECDLKEGKLLVGLVYRSPSSDPQNNDLLLELIKLVADSSASHKLIMGDFNYPKLDWVGNRGDLGGPQARNFKIACDDAFLIQHIQQPTRIREGQEPSLVDLVLTNREDMISDISLLPGLGKSDHSIIIGNLACSPFSKVRHAKFNYKKADFNKLLSCLDQVDWDQALYGLSVDDAWSRIKMEINKAVESSVPKIRPGGRRKPWMDRDTLETVRNKYWFFREWMKTKSKEDYLLFTRARNKSTKAIRVAKKRLETAVAEDSKKNPKAFWSYVNSKTKTRSGVPNLNRQNGSTALTDIDKAEELNNFFQSVFTLEGDGALPPPPDYGIAETLDDIVFSKEDVKNMLDNLNVNKAPGPDGIGPLILKTASSALAYPLSIIFNLSMRNSAVPTDWKRALITPIFKKGNKALPGNYRPVSLTCIVCKVMEKMIKLKIVQHLEKGNLISPHQHGFVKGRSCITQLLEVLDIWTEVLDEGGSIDVIYMDFQKAFDTVPHRRLILKAEAHGIGGRLLGWLKDFLANREQRVVVNGTKSSSARVTSGVPQGSVLGPVLFLLFINDLPNGISNFIKMFADDTKLFSEPKHADDHSLQNDLDVLQDWSEKWLMSFHPEKCKVLKIGRQKSSVQYNINNVILEETEAEKDLGVIIDNQLSFKSHIASVTAKANKVVGIIRRSFNNLTEDLFVQLFKSLVRPILEYGHSVWNPNLKHLSQEVERVQRRATGLLGSLKNLDYSERLQKLELPSLEHRRKRGDMIDTYKYVHGLYDSARPNLTLSEITHTRGNSLKLKTNYSRLNVRKYYFSHRVVTIWNSLPEEVVTAPSINSFKARLDKHWEELPTKYNPECFQ